jgi:hypothetical protein
MPHRTLEDESNGQLQSNAICRAADTAMPAIGRRW